jgi:beta-lactamase class A
VPGFDGEIMRPILAIGLTLAVVAWPGRQAASQEAHLEILAEKFQAELEEIAWGFDGVAGIHVIDLTDGRNFDIDGDLVFPQASAIKIPILLELFRRADSEPGLLSRRVDMTDRVRTLGSGVLHHLTDGGSSLSLEDYAIYMIVYSDNTATNVLIDALGMEAINRLSASLGAPSTKVQRKMIQPRASARGDENLSTPIDAARIMTRIASCDLPMSETSCRRIREILEIPKAGPVRRPVPGDVPIAFKPGGITGVATVWALVGLPDRPYVLTVMCNYGGDGDEVVQAASEAAYRYFSKLSGATPYGTRVPLDVKRRVRGGR